jgi:hypothetical protein
MAILSYKIALIIIYGCLLTLDLWPFIHDTVRFSKPREGIWTEKAQIYHTHFLTATATRSLIQKAMNIWQTNTCITFQENAAAPNKLYFTNAATGCSAWLGRQQWAQQEVNIGAGCEYVSLAGGASL